MTSFAGVETDAKTLPSLIPPPLINIILILTPRPAKLRVGMPREKRQIAMLTQAQRSLLISQREPEHRLYGQQQGAEVPHDTRLIVIQPNTIGRCFAAERRHSFTAQVAGEVVHFVFIVVKQEGGYEQKRPIPELCHKPIIPLRIKRHQP